MWPGRASLRRDALGTVAHGVFRNDSKQLATSSTDQTVRLWDTQTGACSRVLRGHGRRISSISFNATGNLLAACGNDGMVRIWGMADGSLSTTLRGTVDQLVSAVFSPVSDTVVAVSNDGGAYMFDAGTGIAERELDVETVSVWAEAFSPDGTILATANDDDTVRLWTLEDPEHPKPKMILIGRAQGWAVINDTGRYRSRP